MKNIKLFLLIILINSFLLSIFGFVVDLGERVPSIAVNILDITMMTVILFTIQATLIGMGYVVFRTFTNRKIRK